MDLYAWFYTSKIENSDLIHPIFHSIKWDKDFLTQLTRLLEGLIYECARTVFNSNAIEIESIL